MQKFVYLMIFAVVLLMFKAFFLDDYLEKRASENNTSVEAVQEKSTPAAQPASQEMNITGMSAEKKSVPKVPEDKKMPLDKLGDSLTKHVDL